jgi:hypothetical protein
VVETPSRNLVTVLIVVPPRIQLQGCIGYLLR